MAFHQTVQRLILLGAHWQTPASVAAPQAPPELLPLIDAVAGEHARVDALAIHFGHRYRSGFWAIYMLSAIAVLFAILPLALGWDSALHRLHPLAGLWTLGEVGVIGTVIAIYWQGHRRDWRGQWLRARTAAELTAYLPIVAPLLDLQSPASEPNWYARVFNLDPSLRAADDVTVLCGRNEALIRATLPNVWSDPAFVVNYAQWTAGLLKQQKRYHRGVANRQSALLHRVHAITGWLFALTALAALLHLVVHTLWLSLVTTFFPSLGASLHGALAQSEAYRLRTTSERISLELKGAVDRIHEAAHDGAAEFANLKAAIEDAVALLLEEHQDWHMLVQPHHLPLG